MLTLQKSEILEKISIADIVSRSGLTVVQRGSKLTTMEHESLVLYPEKNTWAWFSQTNQMGKPLGGNVIDWYMHINRCDFKTALNALAGNAVSVTTAPSHKVEKRAAAATNRDYRAFALECMENLPCMAFAPCMAYLAQRGISLDTAQRFGIGAHHYRTSTEGDLGFAVTFPYRNVGDQTVVNMRLIERTSGDKCRHWGQRGGLFGEKLCKPAADKYLFAVEGELNAVSIAVAADWLGVDVVSTGNKSLSDPVRDKLVGLASGYRRLFVWTDEAQDTQKILASATGAIGYKSPAVDSKKIDANDMLIGGALTGYVSGIIAEHADSDDARRLYQTLIARHNELEAGLDEYTYAVAEKIVEKWKPK